MWRICWQRAMAERLPIPPAAWVLDRAKPKKAAGKPIHSPIPVSQVVSQPEPVLATPVSHTPEPVSQVVSHTAYRHRDAAARREYMREYMRSRRAMRDAAQPKA